MTDNYNWEQRKLLELVERVTRKNKNSVSKLPLTISAQDGLIDQNIYFKKQVASRDMSNYYLIKKGEFAYNKSYSKDYPVGTVKRLDKYNQGALSSLYIVFKPTLVNSSFLVSYYESNRWHREVQKRAAEGARNHGLLNISTKDFLDTDLKIPSSEVEQSKIGELINLIDNTIALHQRKLDKVKQVKKAYMQVMFPKKGEVVPRLRFTDFNDEWEQRKLGEVAVYRNGKAHEKNISENGEFIVINSKFVSTNGKIQKYSDKQIEPMRLNEIAFVLSDVPNGRAIARTFLVDKDNKYSLNQRIAGITPHLNTNAYFLYILMNRHNYFLRFDNGVGQTNLSKKDVESFSEKYPSIEEQNKIGQFFKQLDNTITLHQSKLDKLKLLKKSYLQKMFI